MTPTIAPDIYLTPIPPTSTFTPSPTPTPVMHTVQQGDTLFGIALEYGVTVDGLVRVNGLDESAYLSIGQVLIIPVEEEEALSEDGLQAPAGNVILPTPTPMPLSATSVALYQTPVGGLWCLGEVLNTTESPVTNIQVEIVLLAPDGSSLMRTVTLAAADYLPPQARAPFSFLFRSPPEGVTDVDVRLLRGEAISPITAGFVPLTVAESEGSVSGPQYRIRGSLRNESGSPVRRIAVVATIYNAEGAVVGYRQLLLAEDLTLADGSQQPFEVLLTPQSVEPPAGFSLIAWGLAG
ncbi:MAG: LysM peptidoglycan-binding domain-containing protein [Anaerolineae bacterium]